MPQTSDSHDFNRLAAENPGAPRVLAEGDSWFAYPRRFLFFGSDANIIDHLADPSDYDLVIYNTSSNGDEAVAMLSGDQKFGLIKRLRNNSFDYLLFSGGGNDIVGKFDFDFFIREMGGGDTWQDVILTDRVDLKMSLVEGTYRTLCELVAEHSANPGIRIITHTYEQLTPRDEGFELFDLIPMGKSWLHPFMTKKGITDSEDQKAIVRAVLTQFKEALGRVVADYPILRVVDTHGTVDENEWRNEIHPNPSGFGKLARRIYDEGIAV